MNKGKMHTEQQAFSGHTKLILVLHATDFAQWDSIDSPVEQLFSDRKITFQLCGPLHRGPSGMFIVLNYLSRQNMYKKHWKLRHMCMLVCVHI